MNDVATPPAHKVTAEEADALPVDITSIEVTCARALRPLRLLPDPRLTETTRTLRGHLKLLIPADLDTLTTLPQSAAREALRLLALPDCADAETARNRARALAQSCLILLEPHRVPAAPTAEAGPCPPPAQGGS
ncbi:DUF6415 family natural product biosynthesis protein [Streptomyces rimosus]|uniref:DUF6415 family natural product biosynthesis protein n=1 Tax=Streptomyces rimosus TaxID=1927 RepID=UPI000A7E5FAD|nr:DUF6415 family natural product biosynthesis protein [Streptomyces rimosus]